MMEQEYFNTLNDIVVILGLMGFTFTTVGLALFVYSIFSERSTTK